VRGGKEKGVRPRGQRTRKKTRSMFFEEGEKTGGKGGEIRGSKSGPQPGEKIGRIKSRRMKEPKAKDNSKNPSRNIHEKKRQRVPSLQDLSTGGNPRGKRLKGT